MRYSAEGAGATLCCRSMRRSTPSYSRSCSRACARDGEEPGPGERRPPHVRVHVRVVLLSAGSGAVRHGKLARRGVAVLDREAAPGIVTASSRSFGVASVSASLVPIRDGQWIAMSLRDIQGRDIAMSIRPCRRCCDKHGALLAEKWWGRGPDVARGSIRDRADAVNTATCPASTMAMLRRGRRRGASCELRQRRPRKGLSIK